MELPKQVYEAKKVNMNLRGRLVHSSRHAEERHDDLGLMQDPIIPAANNELESIRFAHFGGLLRRRLRPFYWRACKDGRYFSGLRCRGAPRDAVKLTKVAFVGPCRNAVPASHYRFVQFPISKKFGLCLFLPTLSRPHSYYREPASPPDERGFPFSWDLGSNQIRPSIGAIPRVMVAIFISIFSSPSLSSPISMCVRVNCTHLRSLLLAQTNIAPQLPCLNV